MTVMFGFVWSIAFDTMRPLEATCECGVAPLPAIFALWNAGVHISSSHRGNEVSYIEALINDSLSQRSVLRVPNINPHNSHIGLGHTCGLDTTLMSLKMCVDLMMFLM